MNETKRAVEDRLREAGDRLEEEVQRAVKFLDDEVVPEIRRNSSTALRTVADKLRQLAQDLDDERRRHEDSGI